MPDDSRYWFESVRPTSALSRVRFFLSPMPYAIGLEGSDDTERFREVVEKRFGIDVELSAERERLLNSLGTDGAHCAQLLQRIHRELNRPCAEWRGSLEPWSAIVEEARSGGRRGWRIFYVATCAIGVVGRVKQVRSYPDLFDEEAPLCGRIETARRMRAMRWWRKSLLAEEGGDSKMALAVALSWAPASVLRELQSELEKQLERLRPRDWQQVINALVVASRARRSAGTAFRSDWLARSGSARLAVACAHRCGQSDAHKIYEEHLSEYRGTDRVVARFCQHHALEQAQKNPKAWPQSLRMVQRTYAQDAIADGAFLYRKSPYAFVGERTLLPSEVAAQICNAPHQYPLFMLQMADARRTSEVQGRKCDQ